ncbi:MAG TPA: hypothetical protein GXZ98_10640, partial [Firmicutes bacterium]|nr:hypothetical protein [Bacillota bacterium]
MNRKFVYWVLPFLLIILLLSGCGPKKTPKQPSTPTLKTIKIINETGENSVYTEGTLQFSAEGYDQNGRKMEGITFEWSVDPAKFGEITQDGKFTAGKEAGECQVVCAANGVVQKVTVTIKGKLEPSKPTKIVIKPDKPKVLVGSQVQFEATVMDQYDQAMSNVEFEWILAEGAGEITADGLFTAGNNPGIYELICKAGDISSDPVQIEVTTVEEHLQKAGEQLVSDSQTAWNSFTQSGRLPIILNQELMPHAELIFSVVDDVTEHVMWYSLFCLPARDYTACTEEEIWDLILELELEDYTPGEGTWRYKKEVFDENDVYLGMWTVEVTRLESEENEEFKFDLTYYEEHMGVTNTYSGTINQPLIDDDEINEGDLISRENLFDIEFRFGNEINGQMRISAEGTEQVIEEEC